MDTGMDKDTIQMMIVEKNAKEEKIEAVTKIRIK
jgi:hypothetical protein